MWYSVFLIICILVVKMQAAPADSFADDMKQRKQIAVECIKQVNINTKVIEKAMHDIDDLPVDNEYKEFLTCSYKKQKFQSEEGEILYDNIVDFLSRFYKRGDLKVLDKCRSITAENDADMAFSALQCILKNLREMETTSNSV